VNLIGARPSDNQDSHHLQKIQNLKINPPKVTSLLSTRLRWAKYCSNLKELESIETVEMQIIDSIIKALTLRESITNLLKDRISITPSTIIFRRRKITIRAKTISITY